MQKFNKGDKVKVADDLGPHMSHFQGGMEAIVIGSYKDKYGGSDIHSYTIHIQGRGEISWYHEHQMELIEKSCYEELNEWEDYLKNKGDIESNIDWIFKNGLDVASNPSGYSLQSLFNCLRKGSLWGSRGEGVDYYANARAILYLAKPFLERCDKKGWLAFAESYKSKENK